MTQPELTPRLSRDEVYRRIGGSLDRISDADIGGEVIEATRCAPEYFWIRPGSYSGYHNGHRHGLWLHTLKVVRAIDVLGPSFESRGLMTARDFDRAYAAAILHDQWKNGPDAESDHTDSDHPRVMADIIRHETLLDEYIARAVEEHMGGFDQQPFPSSGVSRVLHQADMMASDDSVGISIYGPAPSELGEYAHDSLDPQEAE